MKREAAIKKMSREEKLKMIKYATYSEVFKEISEECVASPEEV